MKFNLLSTIAWQCFSISFFNQVLNNYQLKFQLKQLEKCTFIEYLTVLCSIVIHEQTNKLFFLGQNDNLSMNITLLQYRMIYLSQYFLTCFCDFNRRLDFILIHLVLGDLYALFCFKSL